MKRIVKAVWEGYSVAAAGAGILVMIALIALFASGSVTREKLRAAAQALKEKPVAAETPKPPRVDAEWRDFEEGRRKVKADQDRREAELVRVRRIAQDELNRIEAERKTLDQKIAESKAAAAAADQARAALAAAENDTELETNVPIFEKMEGAAILSLIQGWEDPRIVRYLRAMKASKAAEVLEAMRTEPQFEEEFRRPPAGAPRDARTRFELVMDEFKKVPKTEPQ